MKYLGIDFGSKKIGVASSDESGDMAFPLMIIKREKRERDLQEVSDLVREMKIGRVVIGESVNQNGIPNEIAKEARKFAFDLENIFESKNMNCDIAFEKEWYSTVEARRYDDRRDADDSAAAIILQRYLDKQNNKKINSATESEIDDTIEGELEEEEDY